MAVERDPSGAKMKLGAAILCGAVLVGAQLLGAVSAFSAPVQGADMPLDWPAFSGLDAENIKAKALVDRARAAYLAGDFKTAIALDTELLKLKPADARAYYNRGNAYLRLRDLDRALGDFTEALKIAPNLYLALMNRGNIFSQQKKYSEAIADYDKAAALKPDAFLIFFNRGIAFGRLGDLNKSFTDLSESIRLNPKDAMSYSSRGDILYRQRQFEAARKDYVKAVELDSTLAHASERLRVLALAQTTLSAPGVGIDTSTVTAEISHRQEIEKLVELASQSCLQNGEDEQGLAALAGTKQWTSVGAAELDKVSTAATTMVGGWTLNAEAGLVAIMQSRMKEAPGVHICSMTAKLASPHLFDDFRTAFEGYFKVKIASPIEQTADMTLRYWLPHRPICDAKTSVVMSKSRGTVTVRMLHGRKADGA